ncbi:hypothetical protein [Abiotrophia defectiva]|uniref:hypothetical protein n=1 Tax=Abiotrophia defectiva TaxID=46125 RepID=UPI0026ED0646|nr:hypothetical protein [Abiotrophia defectiva]
MSLKRVVDTRFWNQVDVMERYSSQDKLFALYLMTCPRSTQLGIYSLPKRVIAFDMSLDDAQVGQLLARFQDDYQVIAYSDQTQEVAILDFLTYSLVKGGQPVERLLRNQAEDVRDSQLLVKVFQHLASYYEHSHRLIDQLSQEVLATELKRRQELGHEGEGVTSLSQGMQLGSLSQGTQLLGGSQGTHGASRSLSTSGLRNQDPNQKDNQIHKENQSHNHNQNHNSASKLDSDSEGKLDARELGESSTKEVLSDWAASSATSSCTPVSGSAPGTNSSTSVSSLALGANSSTSTSSQSHTTSSNTTSSQPFGQAINLPDQSLSQTLARAQSLTSKPGQSQAGVSQQTMDQFVRVERDMAKLRPFYERYFGPMSGAESLQFRNWLDKIGYWPVIEAIEQAHRRQAKKPFAYISTICQQASKA